VIRHLHQADVGNILRTSDQRDLISGCFLTRSTRSKNPRPRSYQREHGALWVRDEALVAHLRRASADGALRRCGAVSGRLFSASSAQPNQVGTSGDISGTGRAPLGFDSGMFRRSEATSLPSDSTWPCSLDRATVWPCACSRRRVSEIRQGGSSCVLAELLLQEMRLDGLRSPKAAPRRAK
jgi:hypothetical protein